MSGLRLRTLRLARALLGAAATFLVTSLRAYAVLWVLMLPSFADAHNCGSPDDCQTPPPPETRPESVPLGGAAAGAGAATMVTGSGGFVFGGGEVPSAPAGDAGGGSGGDASAPDAGGDAPADAGEGAPAAAAGAGGPATPGTGQPADPELEEFLDGGEPRVIDLIPGEPPGGES